MGRLGRLPVKYPESVKLETKPTEIVVSGPRGTLKLAFRNIVDVKVSEAEKEIVVSAKSSSKAALSTQGAVRSHIANMVKGVTEGWKKELEINGPGYRAEVRGKDLVLMVGYSHPVAITAPGDLSFKVEKNIITVEGTDKNMVGHVSSLVRDSRRPNPYTGSGVKYKDEVVRRKAGKQAGKAE